MVSIPVSEVLVGIYVGLLAGIFPAFVAFSIGFGFKYFTDITVPGLGVVVLGGALAGISGGLMGLVDPQLTESWTGVSAILVVLMASLWAHSQGDKLGAATPRRLTLASLGMNQLSADIVDRVDSYGQVRIRSAGEVENFEGFPPLSDELRAEIGARSWRFPGKLPVSELESRLADRLERDHDLSVVEVEITDGGEARIRAAPSAGGLSRRIEPGRRAVTVQTLLPTGLARGDEVTLVLPDGEVRGPVVSARTTAPPATETEPEPEEVRPAESPDEAEAPAPTPRAPTATGGHGEVTVSLPKEAARGVLQAEFAPMRVHSSGDQPEFEAVGLLKDDGNRFRKVVLGAESPLVGRTVGSVGSHDTSDVALLAIRRTGERLVAPRGTTTFQPDDALIVVGKPEAVRAFAEESA